MHPLVIAIPMAMISLLALAALVRKSPTGYVAHEWGTFTSVQGGDGTLLEWKPLESSRLPGFVYNWYKPGFGRQPAGKLAFTKAELLTLQRMETPVIYFYAKEPESVDVTVKFPQGLITEWYPQASRIGPSTAQPPWLAARLDEYVHKARLKPGFTFTSLLSTAAASPDSGARWAHVNILRKTPQAADDLPMDSSGSHYFAARETDANPLRIDGSSTTNAPPERERFLFYRGVGNFETPLRVSAGEDGFIEVENTGKEPLSDLYVINLHNGSGHFTYVDLLSPGQQRKLPAGNPENLPSLKELTADLEAHMERSLVNHGLYAREAAAMVHTWRDSWFEEDGVRVLYILPRAWTDRTLPLRLAPEPRELTRVMVGRAELLLPAPEERLAEELTKAKAGDAQARTELIADLRKLNRFAEPALRLATKGAQPELQKEAWELLHLARASESVSVGSPR